MVIFFGNPCVVPRGVFCCLVRRQGGRHVHNTKNVKFLWWDGGRQPACTPPAAPLVWRCPLQCGILQRVSACLGCGGHAASVAAGVAHAPPTGSAKPLAPTCLQRVTSAPAAAQVYACMDAAGMRWAPELVRRKLRPLLMEYDATHPSSQARLWPACTPADRGVCEATSCRGTKGGVRVCSAAYS